MHGAEQERRRPTQVVRGILGWTWYPTLIAVVYILNPFSKFDLSAWAIGRVLAIAVIIAVTLTLLGRSILGRDRGAAAAALAIMGVAVAASLDRLLLVAAGILVIIWLDARLAAKGAIRFRFPWFRITSLLNLFLAAFVAILVVTIAVRRISVPTIPIPAEWQAVPATNSPDIFLVLADAHGRADVLRNSYDYDMSALELQLSDDGFDEASNSHANHVLTRFSLSVLLNGRPFSELGQDMTAPVDERIAYAAVQSSSAAHLLHSAGYETVVVSSGYDHLGLRSADRFIDVGPRNEFEQSIIMNTAAGHVFDAATGYLVAAEHERVFREFDVLKSLAAEPSSQPRFVLVHLPSPHEPIALQADCTLRPWDSYSLGAVGRDNHKGDDLAVRLSADQTACIDSLLGPAITNLVRARPNAVVILFSDHGPEELLDWREPDEPGEGDRFANMFLARTPGHPDLFPDDVTLVNVLPMLFNAYLGTDLPLHPNDLFYGPTDGIDNFVPYSPVNQ
jgi:Sulfatase